MLANVIDKMDNTAKIQEFVKNNKVEIAAFIKEKLFPKIKKDVTVILINNWASEVSNTDLYHVHVMVPKTLSHLTLVGLEASCSLLYHSAEKSYKKNPNRNIRSSFTSEPKVLNWGHTVPTIYPATLDQVEICTVNFSKHLIGLKLEIIWQASVE